ncbi:uncharacterized protein [Typha latifolia]|uniref:uncharacterized protein n=1 Tax=Typha latifolia TaxID=4733 RepID=UPI003C2B1B09
MSTILYLITTPIALVQIVFLLGVRTAALAALLWWQLAKAIVNFHVDMFWQIMVWSVALVTLPIRVLTALQRERKLERLLSEMQIQMERFDWENKDLEERLQVAYKERRVLEAILEEIEEEHDKALARVDLLDSELQDLKRENMRLHEGQGKAGWDCEACHDKDGNVDDGLLLGTSYDHLPPIPWRSANSKSGMILGVPWGIAEQSQDVIKAADPYSFPPRLVSGDSTVEEVLQQGRAVALSRSLFSAGLSLVVGMTVWEAENPCPPLVAALFFVVGMSLCSVVHFFATLKNRPASDAVALLSLNCFILGTITSPTLPNVAGILASRTVRLVKPVLIWLGYTT